MYGYNYAYSSYNNPYYSNPVPDNLQQLRNNNQMQQPMVQQPQQIQQPQPHPQTNNGLIWVQGETAVNAPKTDLNIDLGKYVTRDELNEILANLTATGDTKKTTKKAEKENNNG